MLKCPLTGEANPLSAEVLVKFSRCCTLQLYGSIVYAASARPCSRSHRSAVSETSTLHGGTLYSVYQKSLHQLTADSHRLTADWQTSAGQVLY